MIYKTLSNTDYHALDAISSTAVKAVSKQSVAHWLGATRKETPALAVGSAIHSLTLEPEKNDVLRGPETRRGNAWKDAVAEAKTFNPDAIVLPEAEFDKAQAIADAARANPFLAKYLADEQSKIEMSVILHDPDCGLELRTRPDLYHPDGTVIDLKTTVDASPEGFAKQSFNLAYHIQAFHYCRALELEGLRVKRFIFVAVETSSPYATCAHVVSKGLMQLGRLDWERSVEKIMNYQETGEASTGWPEMNEMALPSWMNSDI